VHAEALKEGLARADITASMTWVRSLAAGAERLAGKPVWAVFLSLTLPDVRGLDTVRMLMPLAGSIPIVVLGGSQEEGLCNEALEHGATDYLLEGHTDAYDFARALRGLVEHDLVSGRLFVEQERARVTLNSIGDAVLSVDVNGKVTYLNVVAEQMTGWSGPEAIGRPSTEVFHIIDSATRQPSPDPLALAIELDKVVGLSANCLLVRRDGHEVLIEDSAAPIHDQDGQLTGGVIVFHDASMARSTIDEMSRRAQYDALTKLPNRDLLKERLQRAILMADRRRTCLAVLFLDLDGFKQINDIHGHDVGDEVLKSVAARLQATLRKSDTVGRLGGDEFVILLTEISHAADADLSAAKVLAELRKPHHIGGHLLNLTASIGISTYPNGGTDADDLLKHADLAMYRAKRYARDTFQRDDAGLRQEPAVRETTEAFLPLD
jgi:diguanylate cyclase (GGDEF)-like protein/PAS domain S-box-containing protein